MKTTLTVGGVVKKIKAVSEEEGKGDRQWWVVEFEKGHVMLIKQWNHEADVTKNQKHGWWNQKDKTVFKSLDEDVIYNLKNARWRLTKDCALKLDGNDLVGQYFDMKFELSSTDPPLKGSCWETATQTMKRATKGWFGMASVSNLWLQEGDEGTDAALVTGAKGARTLDAILWMWYAMRELEQLYAAFLVQAGPDVISPLETSARQKLADARGKVSKIGNATTEAILMGLVNEWESNSLTKAGTDEATLTQLKESPVEGGVYALNVSTKSRRIVYLQHLEADVNNADNFTCYIRQKNGRGRKVPKKDWLKLLKGARHPKTFGWKKGVHGLSHGEEFTVAGKIETWKKEPMQGSKWAMVQFKNGCNQVKAIIEPLCHKHPILGKYFLLERYPGTYKIARVEVLDEHKQIVKITGIQISSRGGNEVAESRDSIFRKWNKKKIIKMANKGQLRLEINTIAGQQEVTGMSGFKMRVKETKQDEVLKPVSIGAIEAESQAHLLVVSARAMKLLRLTVDHVWQPDFGKDDRQKEKNAVLKNLAITGIVIALVVSAAATVVTAGVAGGLFATATVGTAAASATTGGAIVTTVATTTTIPTVIGVIAPTAMFAGPIAATMATLMPGGAPSALYKAVRKQYTASKIARETLRFAENYASMIVTMAKCPPGSASDDRSSASADDPYAVCRRQELDMSKMKESAESKLKKDKLVGCTSGRKSNSRAAKDAEAFQRSLYLMTDLARSLTTVSELQCEVTPDDTIPMKYKLKERWSAMDKRTL